MNLVTLAPDAGGGQGSVPSGPGMVDLAARGKVMLIAANVQVEISPRLECLDEGLRHGGSFTSPPRRPWISDSAVAK